MVIPESDSNLCCGSDVIGCKLLSEANAMGAAKQQKAHEEKVLSIKSLLSFLVGALFFMAMIIVL
jgi:hypothetical protein